MLSDRQTTKNVNVSSLDFFRFPRPKGEKRMTDNLYGLCMNLSDVGFLLEISKWKLEKSLLLGSLLHGELKIFRRDNNYPRKYSNRN